MCCRAEIKGYRMKNLRTEIALLFPLKDWQVDKLTEFVEQKLTEAKRGQNQLQVTKSEHTEGSLANGAVADIFTKISDLIDEQIYENKGVMSRVLRMSKNQKTVTWYEHNMCNTQLEKLKEKLLEIATASW